MKTLKYTSIIMLLIVIISSCRKDKKTIDLDTFSSQDNSTAENLFADIKKVVEEVANDEGESNKSLNNKSNKYSFGSCATVSVSPAWTDTASWPKVITIDFGTSNCTGYYGVKRRGIITVSLTGRYRDPGSVLTVQLNNYYVNDYKVEGTKTLTNNGRNSNNNLSYSVSVSNGKITDLNGKSIEWTSSYTSEWIEGESTTLFTNGLSGLCDDVYLITGSGNGVNRNGVAFSATITSPLRKEICCRWIVSGSYEVAPSGLSKRTVDFGSGTCDNDASVTINGNTYNFKMF